MLRRSSLPLLAVLALAGGLTTAARAEHLYTETFPNEASLKYGNGNKIVIGKLNSLHAVYADKYSGDIGYAYSIDDPDTPGFDEGGGNSWQLRSWNRDGASMPSVAVDHTGKAHVVWIENTNAEGVGKMFYTRRTTLDCVEDNPCWTTPVQISASATEPSLVAQGSTLHLTWTNRYQVRYTTFAAATPPTGNVLGELVQYSVCPETKFYQPSVALVTPPCKIIPTVAFLVSANEPETFGGICFEGAQIGPRVVQRNMVTNTWVPLTTSFLTPVQPPLGVAPTPVSLSLSSNAGTQSLFLAWSDEINGSARTSIAYSRTPFSTWGTSPITSAKRYVHIRGKASNSIGQFRLAASALETTATYPDNLAFTVWYATGRWSNPGPALSWLEAPPQPLSTAYFPTGLSPQGIFWRKCTGANPRELKAYGIFHDGGWPDLTVFEAAPCTTPSVNDTVLQQYCQQQHHLTAFSLGHFLVHGPERRVGSALDFDEGVVTSLDDKGAVIKTATGGKIQITWPSTGKVMSSWEHGFFVSAPAESLRITSDESYTIDDLGWLEKAK